MLSTFLNVALLARTHRDVLVREGSLLLVPAVAATPLLAWASRRVDGRWLTIVAGGLTIVSAAALLIGLRWERGRSPVAGVIAGITSAAMNVIGSIGGPALALYTVNAAWPPRRARPTLQVVFLVSNVVAIVSLGLPHVDATWVGLLGALAAGLVLGLVLARRVPEHAARIATLGVAAAGGLVAITRAW